jgi:glycosyltransferase involved in cell wall biosynthesis
LEKQVLVFTPFPLDSLQGNTVSALRIARLLRQAGVPARAIDVIPGPETVAATALIALHACRSVAAMEEFAQRFPGRPRHLLLPGSDLFRCLPEGDPRPLPAMEAADSLVVANEALVACVPGQLRDKLHVIPKSLATEVPHWAPVDGRFRVIVVAHLRAQKDPLLAARAVALLADIEELELEHVGAEVEEGCAVRIRECVRRDPRCHWLGQLPHHETVARAAASHVLLNTSLMEGGANALCEALHIGMPVVATDIVGNVGMLGEDHPGLFPVGDAGALADLLRRARNDSTFLAQLASCSRERARLFTPEHETRGWLELLGGSF